MNHYFQSYQNYFWQWEDDGGVMAIPNGGTIAYKALAQEWLDKLAPQGLPPFGSLLLAVMATNTHGNAALDTVFSIVKPTLDQHHTSVLKNAINFLKLLSELPAPYREGNKRTLLFQAIFERCHNIASIKNSLEAAKQLKEDYFGIHHIPQKSEPAAVLVYRDFRPLELLNHNFKTAADIINKMASLPPLPEDPVLPDDAGEQETIPKDFIEQLTENPKTFFVGSLVKRIWSGLNIPVHSNLPSQQPLGGISDLTNKGDFDKLLVSEFANDDIVFLSRLANNEALYIHREIPPSKNNLQRVILIDVTLKNWGAPKIMAFATALAIAKHPKTDIDCAVYVVGEQFYPVSIDRVDTLIDALMILEGSLHPANGLAAFFKEYPVNKNMEIFLVTTPTVLKQPAMLRAMNEYSNRISYWIYTDAEGNIDVYKKQQSSKKHIQHLQLPLKELWTKEPRQKPTGSEQATGLAYYPILFPQFVTTKIFLSVSDGQVFKITPERLVFRRFDVQKPSYNKGWDLVYGTLPSGSGFYEAGIAEDGSYMLLCFYAQNREAHLVNLSNGKKIMIHFQHWKASNHSGFIFYNGRFIYQGLTEAWSIAVNGHIEKEELIYGDYYSKRAESLKEAARQNSSAQTVLKNINRVFINESKNLVVNKHELLLNIGNHLKLEQSVNSKPVFEAMKTGDLEFSFRDGSQAIINRAGIITLRSSNPNIPVIYVPSVLDAALGVATDTAFAGNKYYYKEEQFEVILKDAGVSKLNTVKSIKDIAGKSLADAKEIVDVSNSVIFTSCGKEHAINIKKTLEAGGAQVDIKPARQLNGNTITSQEDLGTRQFFQNYIRAFTEHIAANGA